MGTYYNLKEKKNLFWTNKKFVCLFQLLKLRKNRGNPWGKTRLVVWCFGPGICVLYFLSFPERKSVTRENWDKLCVYFSILPNCQVPNLLKPQNHEEDFFQIQCASKKVRTVSFIIQKPKSKHLVCLSFLCLQFFLREREKIFYRNSGPWSHELIKVHIL